jgi:hypothetical protein
MYRIVKYDKTGSIPAPGTKASEKSGAFVVLGGKFMAKHTNRFFLLD